MLTRILRAGISDSLSVHQSKRVLLINKYCLSIACITLPYVFIFLFAGAPMLGLLVIPVVLGY